MRSNKERGLRFMIKRELYMKRIRPFIGSNLIKVMTGIRRCGKSVMLELIKQELIESGVNPIQFISINFEDLNYSHLQTAKSLHDEITNRAKDIDGKVYLFFDEIQEVKDWEKCINSFRVSLDCDIYITGSNAKLLSGELATYLGGRYVEFVIYPFSFGEFIELYRPINPDASIQQCFQKYLITGGMPYLANIRYADEPSKQYLHDLFNSVQLKDIVKCNKIRDVDLLERIIAYVIANVGTTFSARSLTKFLKSEQRTVAPETTLNYTKYCCDAYLFYQVKRVDLQGKQILSTNEKYYIADHGIREAVFGGNMRDINLILENIVYLELLRRGYKVTVGKTGEKEIDFVCDKRGDKLYVQVTYLLASEDTIKREFGAYDTIRDNFPKYVVSLDEFDMSRNGIKHQNIRNFLLAEEWT
jgi:predicted AAA+ superfamily ATPase